MRKVFANCMLFLVLTGEAGVDALTCALRGFYKKETWEQLCCSRERAAAFLGQGG